MFPAIQLHVFGPMDNPDHATLSLVGHLMKINHWEYHKLSGQIINGQEPHDFSMCHAIFE